MNIFEELINIVMAIVVVGACAVGISVCYELIKIKIEDKKVNDENEKFYKRKKNPKNIRWFLKNNYL